MESHVQTVHVEARLLLIPVIFILLRIWGTLQFFVSIAASDKIDKSTKCVPHTINVVFQVLGILQVRKMSLLPWQNVQCKCSFYTRMFKQFQCFEVVLNQLRKQ